MDIELRVINEAKYMIETKQTIRQIAKEFGVSKSTVHKDLKERLRNINYSLFKEVSTIVKNHLETRHIKGGQATKIKYQRLTK